MKPCIIVHGGASNIADIFVERCKFGTRTAAKAGYAVLREVYYSNVHIYLANQFHDT